MDRLYYAHALKQYNSAIEATDLAYLKSEFSDYEIVNPNSPEIQADFEQWKKDNPDEHQMRFFKPIVQGVDLLVYRTDKGTMTSGVRYEINKAIEAGVEVFNMDELIQG